MRTLTASGHTCDEAEDGAIAVDKVKEKGLIAYDAILMDFVMVIPPPPPTPIHPPTHTGTFSFHDNYHYHIHTYLHNIHTFLLITTHHITCRSFISRWWMVQLLPRSFDRWVLCVLSLAVRAIPSTWMYKGFMIGTLLSYSFPSKPPLSHLIFRLTYLMNEIIQSNHCIVNIHSSTIVVNSSFLIAISQSASH